MSNVSRPDVGVSHHARDVRLDWAAWYLSLGWQLFVVGPEKRPLPSCANCPPHGQHHNAERCGCLTCHGFYAATNVPNRIALMLRTYPDTQLAVRTGRASEIVVIDAESTADDPAQPSGLDVLTQWESWVGGWSLPHTLTQRTRSGGIHVVVRYPTGPDDIPSRNRVLPGVDVKAEPGYAVIPDGRNGRVWLDPFVPIAEPGEELQGWLRTVRGHSTGGGNGLASAGYDFAEFRRDGCPAGHRDFFANDLAFRLRSAGIDYDDALEIMREAWDHMEQPLGRPFTWEDARHKLDRVWESIAPTDELPSTSLHWARSVVIARSDDRNLARRAEDFYRGTIR